MRHLRSARHRRMVEEIASARTAAGLTQRQLAAKLKRSSSYVSKLEAFERRLEFCEFVDIAQACGVDPADLVKRILR